MIATEHFAVGFSDVRAVWGSVGPPARTVFERRAEAWEWVDRQWELWPRPDLISVVVPLPEVVRRFQRGCEPKPPSP